MRGGVCVAREGADPVDGPVEFDHQQTMIEAAREGDVVQMKVPGVKLFLVHNPEYVKYVLALLGGEKLRVQDTTEHGRATIGEAMRVGWSRSAQRLIERGA